MSEHFHEMALVAMKEIPDMTPEQRIKIFKALRDLQDYAYAVGRLDKEREYEQSKQPNNQT